jgi:iron complex outermembrane receptor protein
MVTWFSRLTVARYLCVLAGSVMAISVAPAPARAVQLATPHASDEPALRVADDVSIVGFVRDTSGAPLSNVQVVVSGANRVATTDARGEFIFRSVAAGTYHLDFIRIGYSAQHQVVVVPADGPNIRLTVVMQVATVRLSAVNVTATPTGTDPLNVTQATVQLSGKELQRNLTSSIGQTLSSEPGMATRFNGPMAAAPVIRGLTGERVLVLQDGDRSGDLSSAAGDHLNAVDPSSAERIEVIRGPASLLYGNNALGGVVNVISSDIPTSIPSRLSGYAMGQGESVTPGGVVAAGTTVPVGERFAVTARGGFRKFESMRVGGGAIQDNTNGQTDNLTVGGGYVSPHASVGLVYRQMNFEYGLPYSAGDEKVRIDGNRKMLGVQSTIHLHTPQLTSIKVDGTSQWYNHGEIEETGEVGTTFDLATQTVNVNANTQLGVVKGAFGFQGVFRQYMPTGEEAFTPGADNNNVAAFVFQELPLTRGGNAESAPRLQFGARIDRFAISTKPSDSDQIDRFGVATTRTYTKVASSLGVSVPIASDVTLTANASRGFRAPTVEELFANGFHAAVGTFDVGNPALAPEQSTGLETGLRAQSSVTFAQVNVYYNMIDQYIRPVAVGVEDVDGSSVPRVEYQQSDATLYGVEGQVETKLPGHLVGGLMGDFTRATLRSENENLPYIPAGRVGGSLRYDNGRWSAGGDVKRVFAQNHVSGDALDIATSAYTLLNLSASWLVSSRGGFVHSINFRADNVLDAQYRDATSRIKSFAFNPGRNVSVVYKLLY